MATWQDVLATELSEGNLGHLADVAMEALDRDVPVLRADADLRDLARASAIANLQLVADIATGHVALEDADPPSQTVTFARELARRNVPMSELARTYRIVQHAMWRVGVAGIRRELRDDQAEAIEQLTNATFATGEVMMSRALERYAAERDQWIRSADALRRETVEELLDGAATDIDTASARLRYDLRRSHVGFVVWTEIADAGVEPAATALGGCGALIIPAGPQTISGWCHPGALDLEAVTDTRVALSAPGEGLDGFRRAHAEAREAQRVAKLGRLGGVVRYEDIALAALLTSDLEQATVFAARELSDLRSADPRVAATVLEVLRSQGSPRRAAQQLGVHDNTVAKRVKSAERLLGRRIDERPADLFAALLIDRVVSGGLAE